MTAAFTGHLKRGDAEGTIVGVIKDSWGWEIHLIGTRDPAGGYTLSGTLGSTPPTLKLPNDPRDAAGEGA